jgi:hypothetical protein
MAVCAAGRSFSREHSAERETAAVFITGPTECLALPPPEDGGEPSF